MDADSQVTQALSEWMRGVGMARAFQWGVDGDGFWLSIKWHGGGASCIRADSIVCCPEDAIELAAEMHEARWMCLLADGGAE